MRCCIGASNYLELRIVDCFFLSVLRIISLSISAFGEAGEDKGFVGAYKNRVCNCWNKAAEKHLLRQ